MKLFRISVMFASIIVATGCSNPASEGQQSVADSTPATVQEKPDAESVALAPGLRMKVIRQGEGRIAEAGQIAIVHYTGWLYDDNAENKRGQKFDSSVDRGQHFQFPLGAGRVIKGWDQGVVGMQEGEIRELTIAPELAYGERGAGNVIPPGATLIFEVELAGIQSVEPEPQPPTSPGSQ